ncbi:MAG: DMT family transporter [Candidatus Gracilibacteria bacterium]|nr:DMT family transporter [Candidatus Gracilibacteria bacterium]
MWYFPIVSAILERTGKLVDKFHFNKFKNLKPTTAVVLVFLGMLSYCTIYTLLFNTNFPPLSSNVIGLLLLMIGFSYFQNYFEFKGLKIVDLSVREPINLLKHIFTGLLIFILFQDERNISHLVGIILASLVTIAFNFDYKKFKIKFNSGVIYVILSCFFSSSIVIVTKYLLEILSPEHIFLFRIIGVFLLMNLTQNIFRENLTKENVGLGLLSGLFYFSSNLLYIYSYKDLGVNFTILLMFIGPIFTYLVSYFILKEQVRKKDILLSAILLGIIITTLIK